jgi:hypothetical protein
MMNPVQLLKTGLVLMAFSFALYGRALNHEFVWDDEAHLSGHKNLMSGNLKAIWTQKTFFYIPVSYTLWYVIKKISEDETGKLKPFAFRFSNILLHSFNAFLVFLILAALIKDNQAALAGSLLFLIHPMQVESVVWISEFRGLLASGFAFSSLLFFWRELEKHDKASQIRNSTGFTIASLLFLLGVLSKPSVVILPFCIAALVMFFYPAKLKTGLYALAIWLIIVIPVALFTGAKPAPELKYVITKPWLNPLIAAYSYGFYFLKVVFPLNLSPCYGITPAELMQTARPFIALAFIIAFVFFIYRYRPAQPAIFAGIVFMAIALLPVSGLRSFDYQRFSVVADRYVYFGMSGMALAVARLWEMRKQLKWIQAVIAVFMIFFLILNIRQVPVWKNDFSLWQAAFKYNPRQWAANYNLGVFYTKHNRPAMAVSYYTTAIAANPHDKATLTNRANALARLKKFKESLDDYRAALEVDPNDGSIYYNRALTYYYMGELEKCLADLEDSKKRNFPVDESIIRAIRSEWRNKKQND